MKHMTRQLVTALLPHSCAVRLLSKRQYRKYEKAYPTGRARPHALPSDLIVSLTSYPPRYPTLHLTLQSLLRQNTAPDRIVLYIASADAKSIPFAVRVLLEKGVDLCIVDDVRSYKKLVFTVEEYPGAYIATADDDVFYRPDWLSELVAGQGEGSHVITCHRAHRLQLNSQGNLADYHLWTWDVDDDNARQASVDIMPTGIGGILYPPGTLHPDVSRRELYQRYAPTADDLWFFWCARRVGATYRKVGPRFEQLGWWSAQESRLFDENAAANDEQIALLERKFGNPLRMPVFDPFATAAQ